ncbi:hypothetical protein [Longimycelium tulufanense]|nr:hypothetical protein [Longimycelium tulufanense]
MTNDDTRTVLRVISPCEHGITHHIRGVPPGTREFVTPECRDSRGIPRTHPITAERYPTLVRRR